MTGTLRGQELFAVLSKKLRQQGRKKPLTGHELAKIVGTNAVTLRSWRSSNTIITGQHVANLVDRAMKRARHESQTGVIQPVVEFFKLEPDHSRGGKRMELIAPKLTEQHPYLRQVKHELQNHHGVYIFDDSRGRALYAGKAQRRFLWGEMKSAFNRDRELQAIKRVDHPSKRRVQFRTSDEKRRQIRTEEVSLHTLSEYISAYIVPDGLINAMLVRGFANDLLNKRMEHFAKKPPTTRTKRRIIHTKAGNP